MKKYLFLSVFLFTESAFANWVREATYCDTYSQALTGCSNTSRPWYLEQLDHQCPGFAPGTVQRNCFRWQTDEQPCPGGTWNQTTFQCDQDPPEPEECASGQYWDTNTNECRDFDQQCPSGQVQIGLQCVNVLDCGDGNYAIDADGQTCDFPDGSCPQDQYFHLGTCYQPDDIQDPEPDLDPPTDPNHPDHPNYVDPDSPDHPDHPDYDGPEDPNHPDHPWYEPPQAPEFDDSGIVNRLDQLNQKATDTNVKLDIANEQREQSNEYLEGIEEALNREGEALPEHSQTDAGSFEGVNSAFTQRVGNSNIVTSFGNAANIINLSDGACPEFSIDFPSPIDKTIATTMQCTVFDTISPYLSLVMMAIFTFTAFRIFASA